MYHLFICQALEVEIKWLYDIYYKRQTKVGGILVTMVTDTTAIMAVSDRINY